MGKTGILAATAVLALGVALVGCKSTPQGDLDVLRTAHEHYAAANYDDALAGYRSYAKAIVDNESPEYHQIKLRESICLHRLGRYDEAGIVFSQVEASLLEDPVDVRELHLNQARNAIILAEMSLPVFLEDSPQNAGVIRQRRQAAAKYLAVARDQCSLLLAKDPNDFEGNLGKGICYFHIAVSDNNRQAFNTATDLLERCLQQERENKYALFFLGRVMQEDLGRGELIPAASKLIVQALYQDSVANHDFHFAYRDALLYLQRYEHPGIIREQLSSQPELAKDLEEMAEYLDRYARHGRHDRSDWGQELVRRIAAYTKTYKSWDEELTRRATNLELAEAALKGDGGVYLDAYRKAVELLEEVNVAHRDDPKYVEVRKIAQQGYVEALLETGERLLEIGETELADAKFQSAQKAIDLRYVEDSRKLINRGLRGRYLVEVYRDWKAVAERIQTDLVAGNLEEARGRLNRALGELGDRKADLQDQIAQLQRELENPDITEYVALIGQAEASREKPSEALKHYIAALQLARKNRWVERSVETARALASCYYDLDDHQEALDAISTVASLGRRPTQDDYVLEGKCFYFKRDYAQGAARFDKVSDKTRLNGNDLRVAGLCYLQASNPERAREFLEAAPTSDREVQKGLRECYKELYAKRSQERNADTRELIDLLSRLTVVDPQDFESRLRLGFLLYTRGEEDDNAYKQAYDHIVAATREGFGPRSDREKEIYSRLVAYFSDYVPLAEGNTWTYKAPSGQTREVVVSQEIQKGRFRVVTKVGSAERTETWDDAESVLKRYDPELDAPVELPVRLRTPTDKPIWRYRVKATKYEAAVISTSETCSVAGETYDNCIKVRVTSDSNAPDRYYVFAPGVGEIQMFVGNDLKYELAKKQVDRDSARSPVSS